MDPRKMEDSKKGEATSPTKKKNKPKLGFVAIENETLGLLLTPVSQLTSVSMCMDLVWFLGFYGISTFLGYLTPNPFLCK